MLVHTQVDVPDNFRTFYCYKVTERDGRVLIKIGKTQDVERRGGEHRDSGIQARFELLFALLISSAAVEAGVKKYFEDIRVDGKTEIFYSEEFLIGTPSTIEAAILRRKNKKIAELMGWIRFMLKKPYISKVEDQEVIKALPFQEYSDWSPNPKHTVVFKSYSVFDKGGELEQDKVMKGDFYTDPLLIQAVKKLYGGNIDLDPASCWYANTKRGKLADNYFGFNEEGRYGENGLKQDWYGKVWLNPPFSQWDSWAPKAVGEWNSGRVKCMIILAPTTATTAQYFYPIITACFAVLKSFGRFKFWGPRGDHGAMQGHELYYFGDDVAGFNRVLGSFGKVFIPFGDKDSL